MIVHSEKISNVLKGINEIEIFFLYDLKHKWSIFKSSSKDEYNLHYYPGKESLEQLASFTFEWEEYNDFITYSSEDLKTREAYESMEELYRTVKEKAYGIDKALDDIIADDIP
jgi:hypothetical protein